MTALAYGSAAAVLGAAGYAFVIYGRAVAHGHRHYAHVLLAVGMLITLELLILDASDGTQHEAGLLFANVLGIGAMVVLAQRFARRADADGRPTMMPLRNALVGYVIFGLAVFAAVIAVETDSADKREQIVLAGREACERDNAVKEEITEDRVTLTRLIGAALTDPTLKPPRTAEEDRFVRVFTLAQEKLVPIEPENCVELFPIP